MQNDLKLDPKRADEIFKKLLQQVERDKHPENLMAIYRAFKKTVPFWRRSWVISYLIRDRFKGRLFDESEGSETKENGSRNHSDSRDSRRNESSRSPSSTSQGGKTLWVNIGWDRKMSKETWQEFILEKTSLKKSDLLDIRVKQTFSFLTLRNEKAGKEILKKFDGVKYKGKDLTVRDAKRPEGGNKKRRNPQPQT